MMNKETYFKMVDEKIALDSKLDILHKAYQNIWWKDSNRKIDANLKWTDILFQRRIDLVNAMNDARKNIEKTILKQWSVEYGKTRFEN